MEADAESDLVGPDVDLSNVKIDNDLPEDTYSKRLNKAKKAASAEESVSRLVKEVASIKDEPEEDLEGLPLSSSMVLNSTAEFCRTLGSVSSYVGKEEKASSSRRDFEMDVDQQPEGKLSELGLGALMIGCVLMVVLLVRRG